MNIVAGSAGRSMTRHIPHTTSRLSRWTGPLLGVVACAPGGGTPSPQDAPSASGGAMASATGGAASTGGDVGAGGVALGTGGGSGGVASGGASASGGGEPGVGGAGSGGVGSGGLDGASGGAGPLPELTIYVAGDSTVSTYADTSSSSDQAGWGQMLPEIFSDQVTIDNRAAGGRTALWFHMEGAVAAILEDIQPGDYFFIQFGTNDGNETATFTVDGVTYPRYADPATDFKAQLAEYYLGPARAVSAIPVLVTAPPRNSAYCGTGNSLGAYAQAMRELGEAEDVIVLDLNEKTFDHLAAICPAPTPEDFFFVKPDLAVDGTHFQENGARHMAGFLGECVLETGLGLHPYLLPH